MKAKLTAAVVEKVAPPARGRLEIFDEYLPGFALRVTPAGARSFVARARIKGQPLPVTVTIGDATKMKLADARQKASGILERMRAGADPREPKVEPAAVERNKFETAAEAFIAEHVAKLRSKRKTEAEIRRYLIPAWGSRPIASITADDLGDVIRSIADAGHPHMARLVLAHAKRLFRWAAAPGRSRIKVNPALALSAKKDFDIVTVPRQNALSPEHLRLIWTCAEKLGEPFGPFFRMLLLSGQRRGEVAEMMWGELDLDRERVWNIPAARMKAKRPHEVPLTGAMVDLLKDLHEHRGAGEFVFSTTLGERPISGFSKVKARIDGKIAEARAEELGKDAAEKSLLSPWTIHDIRRSVRTGLGAIPSVPYNVRELVIAHVPPELVETYDLHDYRDEKRQALTLWGERLARIIEPTPANVVRIAR
jgi:integrase